MFYSAQPIAWVAGEFYYSVSMVIVMSLARLEAACTNNKLVTWRCLPMALFSDLNIINLIPALVHT